MTTEGYIDSIVDRLSLDSKIEPWTVVANLPRILEMHMAGLTEGFSIQGGMAIHHTARLDPTAILKAPLVIDAEAYVGAYACLRGGVYIGKGSSIGHGAEVKCSVILDHSAVAHFNFIGDSLIGSGVNFEAGSIVANHFNERLDKIIKVVLDGTTINTGVMKFGALVGDGSKIGANAVLSPGTILVKNSIVGRLELVDQNKNA
jgi:bifunctional N-acetylglucosamine-1-phosphate-uridyltransferase/glucosamine-1-phosphate-acetyltransferase GlmU-like protein